MAWYEFTDRREAGRSLAALLAEYANRRDVIILALPRGGLPVAYEVAQALKATLDVFVVRKIGVPYRRELAMGAVASGGTYAVNHDVVSALGITNADFGATLQDELEELKRRENVYRRGRPSPNLAEKIVILIDDGLATGSSMRVAVDAVRAQGPKKIIVAVPVAPRETCEEFGRIADATVCAYMPEAFVAVGAHYRDFGQVDDREVVELLEKARRMVRCATPISIRSAPTASKL